MNAIVVILAALLAVACGQVAICYKAKCQSLNEDCNFRDTVNFVNYGCKSGLQCVGTTATANGTCQTSPTLLQSCSSTGPACTDSKYTVICDGSTCLYPSGGLGPTEDCSGATTTDYVGGNPCAGVSTCSGGVCVGTNSGDGAFCNDATGNATCSSGFYCAFGKGTNGTNVCAARLDVGGNCTSNAQCKWNLICTTRGSTSLTCQTPFAQAEGAGCESEFDCNANLFCSSGKCTSATNGAACTVSTEGQNQGSCDSGYSCVCNGGTGSTNGKCEATTVPQTLINDVTSYFSCMSSNCKFDLNLFGEQHTLFTVYFTPDSCAAKHCSSQYTNLVGVASPAGTGCGSSPASVISVFAFLVFALAAIALMF